MYRPATKMAEAMPTRTEGQITETIGSRLKRLRLERGFSQRDLSSPGVSYAYISRIEAGARTPSVKALRKLAPKLQVSVAWLETGEDDPAEMLAELVLEYQGRPLPTAANEIAQRILTARPPS